MKADIASTGSWFEDDAALEIEVRQAIGRRDPPPEIAGYEGLREIGQGGQGVVYLATQIGTRRRVAVKVLRERFASAPEARRRFEREIDLAAGLRHPHIVAVFDGGATADGRPYLAMEFVEGAAIDASPAALELRERSSRARLEAVVRMFASVCDAIQHAHQRGVIHRDLKPSNIRVDSEGVARVLDFGLAKAFGASPPVAITATDAEGRRFIGSLPWASPEQAAGRTEAIDVRSDVYALGVTLYQLITGHFPYDVSGDLDVALRNIVSEPPAPPRRYAPALDTDLVTIVLRALAKQPERRYQSAGELAGDLRSWLAREPIAARRDSLWYLIRLTARRRKGTVITASILLVALLAAGIMSFVAWRDAARSAATSEKTLDLLLGSLHSVDPDAEGREARVIDGLDEIARGVDTDFAGEIEKKARIHESLGTLFDRLGRPDRAVEQARKAAAIVAQARGDDDARALAAKAQGAFFLHKAGHSAEAEAELETVLEKQRKLIGPAAVETLTTANYLGRCLIALSRFQEAEKMLAESLALARADLGPAHDATLELLEGLSHARRQIGDLDSAESLQREAYDRQLASKGPDAMATLNALSSLAVVLQERGKLAEAEPLQKSLYERLMVKVGPDHTFTLTAANTYGKILQDLGRLDEAVPLMKAACEGRERILGPDHKDTLLALANFAALRGIQKNYAESEVIVRKVLAARLRTLGPRHQETLVAYNNLATTLQKQDRSEEARQNYAEAARGAEETLGHDHWISALFRANLAATLGKLGRQAEAEPILAESLKTIEAKLGPEHAHTKTVRRYLAALHEPDSQASTSRTP